MVTYPDPAKPEDILAYLAGLIRDVHHCLDDGVSFADTVMADLRPDGHLWSALVRHRALTLLDAAGLSPKRLLNSGIELERGRFTLKVFRSQDDGPPAPGHSRTRRAYYSQYRQGSLAIGGPAIPVDGTNLILDWEATSERAILLALSLPLGVWKHKGQPSIDWRRPVQLDDTGLRFESSDEGLEVPPRFEIGEDEEGEEA